MQTLEHNQKLASADIKIHTAIQKQANTNIHRDTDTYQHLTHIDTRTDIVTYRDAGGQRQWDQILLHRFSQTLGYTGRRTHRTWDRHTCTGIHTIGTQETEVQRLKHTKMKLRNIYTDTGK